jgi:hypothetical protein
VPANADFNITDADALLELVYSKATGRIVVVAGQAVNFWADRYLADEPKLAALRPFTSRDLDLLGDIANAQRIAEEVHAKLERPRKGAASPLLANINVATGGVIRAVQFLRSVRGVTHEEITKNAVPFIRGQVTVYFADPITTLQAKLHNLVELSQQGRNDAKHVEILRLCVPLFLRAQLAAADKTDAAAKQSLRSIQRVLELSESAIARRIPTERQFDWRTLIPIMRLNKVRNPRFKNFRERQFGRWFARKAGSRA